MFVHLAHERPAQVLASSSFSQCVDERLGEPEDRGERGAQLVRHGADQPAPHVEHALELRHEPALELEAGEVRQGHARERGEGVRQPDLLGQEPARLVRGDDERPDRAVGAGPRGGPAAARSAPRDRRGLVALRPAAAGPPRRHRPARAAVPSPPSSTAVLARDQHPGSRRPAAGVRAPRAISGRISARSRAEVTSRANRSSSAARRVRSWWRQARPMTAGRVAR